MTRREAADLELSRFDCPRNGDWHAGQDVWTIPVFVDGEQGELHVWFVPNSTTIEDSYITDWE